MAGIKRHELGIAADVVSPVVRALEEMGFNAQKELGELRLSPVVEGSTADQILNRAAEQLQCPTLGLVLARKIPIGALGVLDYALCTSACLRDGLLRVARHYGVVTQRVTLSLVEGPARAGLSFERRPNVSHSRHWMEFSLAMIAERIRQTTRADVVFPRVDFAHPAPANPQPWRTFFGDAVRFGQSKDHLGLMPAILQHPLKTASASLATLLDQSIHELEPHAGDPFLDRVRRVLVTQLDRRNLGVVDAARQLKMTARTLQRELETRKTSYKALMDEVRRERALRLLEDGHTIAEAAHYLAFSAPSAFFRAFRRWTGTSPGARQRPRSE